MKIEMEQNVNVMRACNELKLALLASFYLLDFDYPRMQEIGLNVLQHYIFKDTNVLHKTLPIYLSRR
jgi:hypothetical protein